MKTRLAIAGTGSARSSTNAGGECSQRARREPPARAGLRWSLGSPGLLVRPSIAARTISMARNRTDDHGRSRRLEWRARASVEDRTAEARRRDEPDAQRAIIRRERR